MRKCEVILETVLARFVPIRNHISNISNVTGLGFAQSNVTGLGFTQSNVTGLGFTQSTGTVGRVLRHNRILKAFPDFLFLRGNKP